MKRTEDTFEFPQELGKKLRDLRVRAGLSIEELVHRMVRSKGFRSHLSKLERGKLRFPGLALIADYLRVCRASFAELVPILDKYTSKPVPLELAGRKRVKALISRLPQEVRTGLDKYDIKTSVHRCFSGKTPLEPDKREMRIRNQARAWLERNRLDQVLNTEMDNIGVLPVLAVRKFVFDYAHKLWRILKQTRPKPGKVVRPDKRAKPKEQRLAEAEDIALKENVVPIAGLRLIRKRTLEIFEQMEKAGELDYLPTLAQARQVTKPLSMGLKAPTTPTRPGPVVPARPEVCYELLPHIRNLVKERMEAEGIKADRLIRYFIWLQELAPIALETQPDSPERTQRTEALVNATSDPTLSHRVAELYFEVFEHWRPKLFREQRDRGEG